MKGLKITVAGLCLLMVCGCQTKQGTGTLVGAGGGAVLGGIIGNIIGKDSKATAIGAAIGGAVGAGAGTLIGRHMDKVAQETAAQVENAKVEEVTDTNGLKAVKVTFDSGLLFATGQSTLAASAKKDLSDFATVLKNNSTCDVDIQGYTDNQGWKNSTAAESTQKNQALSLDRATSVSSYLQALGVPSSQIKSVQGFGESNPVADNSTASGRQSNRRVEVYLYASQEMVNQANNGTLK
ncbi:MAG: OmpA family protein [Prevotella sp.]|jgi:outer membrane protein OmpA-like peptidoglycan-associated protein